MVSSSVFRPGFGMVYGLAATTLSSVVLGLVVTGAPGLAKEVPQSQQQVPGQSLPFTAQQEKAVPAIKQAELQKLRAINSLNRQSQACIEGSTTLEALDRCHRQFRQAMHALSESFHQQISQLRDRYGLPKPNPPQRHRHGQADQS
jgi:hypothetical protein